MTDPAVLADLYARLSLHEVVLAKLVATALIRDGLSDAEIEAFAAALRRDGAALAADAGAASPLGEEIAAVFPHLAMQLMAKVKQWAALLRLAAGEPPDIPDHPPS